MTGTPSPILPLESLSVDLPFHPTLFQRLLALAVVPLSHLVPVPRSQEILSLARTATVLPVPKQLPRRLFCNAIRQSLLLVTGGWRQLDLSPLQDVAPCWTQTGTPTLFLSMHHGNWEWLAGILYHLRKDSLGVARAAHQRPGQILLDHVRSFHRTPVLYNQAGTRAAHRTLRRGGLVAFLADQRPPTHGEPGTWMGQPTRVSPLPRLWCRGIQADLWTGALLPMSTSYRLTLRRYPSEAIAHWDKLLDQDFAPLVAQSPEWHFGLFHRRLVPPGTPT